MQYATQDARCSRGRYVSSGGMRGLMAKPQKNLQGFLGEKSLKTPILSNFKEVLIIGVFHLHTTLARKCLARYLH